MHRRARRAIRLQKSTTIAATSSTPAAASAAQRIAVRRETVAAVAAWPVRSDGLGRSGQERPHRLPELGGRRTGRAPDPLQHAKLVGNARAGLRRVVDDHRQQEGRVIGHQVRAVHRKLPLKSKIPFAAFVRVGGDHRDEQGAVVDLLADLMVPHVPAAQFALIEPHFDPGRPQRFADAPRRLGVLRGVAQEHSPCGSDMDNRLWPGRAVTDS